MKPAVVLVEPEYDMNVGMCARVMKNFGLSDLRIVNPKCALDFDAVMYSKHAVGLLRKAKKYKSLEGAVKGCHTVIGTTGVLRRHRGTVRNALPLQGVVRRLPYYEGKKLAILFGREGIGLSREEINRCDLLAHVETDEKYPILNISHSLAVVLYALQAGKAGKWEGEKPLPKTEKDALNDMFKSLADRYKMRNPERVKVAFRRVLARAQPTQKEGRSMLNLLRKVTEELHGGKA